MLTFLNLLGHSLIAFTIVKYHRSKNLSSGYTGYTGPNHLEELNI